MQSYPLEWPPAWPRCRFPVDARFGKHTLTAAVKSLLHELSLLGARSIVVSTNLTLRKSDGLPKSGQCQPVDRGVAVYFELKKKPACFPCDRWAKIEDNVWAIALSIGALRGLNRWGAKEMVDAAFTGFKALPETAGAFNKPYWEVLGMDPDAGIFEAEEKYRKLAFIHHPDHGGNATQMAQLNGAIEQARNNL